MVSFNSRLESNKEEAEKVRAGPGVRVRGLKFKVFCLWFRVEELEWGQVADEGARTPLPGWFSFTRRVALIHKKALHV